MTPYFKMFARI